MIQLFAIGEQAILQSLDAPIEMWNVRVTVMTCKWVENPLDVYGMPQPSTYVYEIDLCDRRFVQTALRKIGTVDIKIKEKIAVSL